MAAINPKLEFYRFKLNHRLEEFETFKQFAIKELNAGAKWDKEKILDTLYRHFMNSLNGKYAKDDKLKKQIKFEKKKSANKYLDNKPKYIAEQQIICGVINGGSYGRDGIMGDVYDPEEGNSFGKNKSILQYYYFLLYLPLDHNEGCIIIHSNSKEESITNIFRNFISNIFRGTSFHKAIVKEFSPKSFQDEFRKGAVIQSFEFVDTELDNTHTVNGLQENIGSFDVKIEIIPNNKDISMSSASILKKVLMDFSFGKKSQKQLKDFDKSKIITKNPVDNSVRTFEWNKKDNDFIPVVWLEGRVSKNEDDTPNFDELEELCINYLKDEVLPDLRPELYVSKAK